LESNLYPVSRHREVLGLGSKAPKIGAVNFVAPSANVIGDVQLGNNSGVWYGAILKGDLSKIRIGENSLIKDRAVLSSSVTGGNISIGNNVIVGHGAVVGAATIEDGATIGMGATVGDGAVVQKGAYVAPGSVVEPKTTVPGGQVGFNLPYRFCSISEH
jgi:carbonic anhydrase/acetyltransferase-like protein (isoleucine patch superfamily)